RLTRSTRLTASQLSDGILPFRAPPARFWLGPVVLTELTARFQIRIFGAIRLHACKIMKSGREEQLTVRGVEVGSSILSGRTIFPPLLRYSPDFWQARALMRTGVHKQCTHHAAP